jgi:DNA-binding IclR family transcriptional regulator
MTNESTGIQSIEVGLSLLKVLAEASRALSLTELADQAQMPRSKVHKYLASFVRSGFVMQTTRGGLYDLGPSALDLGLAALRRLDVIEISQPTLDGLRDRLDITVALNIWGNRGPTMIRWAETPHITPYAASPAIRLGTVFPLLTTTVGLVFAAYLDRRITQHLIDAELADQRGLAARVGISSMRDVEATLAKLRKRGLIGMISVVAPGVASIAAPVFAHTESLAGVISVVGIQGQLDLSAKSEAARILNSACKELSIRLGSEAHAAGDASD